MRISMSRQAGVPVAGLTTMLTLAICVPTAIAAGVGGSPTGVPRGGGPSYKGSLTRS
jgi:hypothetical protein